MINVALSDLGRIFRTMKRVFEYNREHTSMYIQYEEQDRYNAKEM